MSVAKKVQPPEGESAQLQFQGETLELPVVCGTEGEKGLDISQLRSRLGLVTLDEGFVNTASCQSEITYLDGERGILHYRGHAIEDLAEKEDFLKVSTLLLYGEADAKKCKALQSEIARFGKTPKPILEMLQQFPKGAHPMGMLSSLVVALSGFNRDKMVEDPSEDQINILFGQMMAQLKNLAGYIGAFGQEKPILQSKFPELSYAADFYYLLTGKKPDPVVTKALDVLLILHADHEQNCSTSTVRLVGSSKANLYACISSGINALWGPLHGGANQAVIEMLEAIRRDGGDFKKYLQLAKDKSNPFRLMGFGHRVYKNFDPRAKIIKKTCDEVLTSLGVSDPLLEIAKGLEQEALRDEYFVSRKLYPNVDFYSGIIYKALGIEPALYTVLFALGRLPGWLAQWQEMRQSPQFRIGRPRQIYQGIPKP